MANYKCDGCGKLVNCEHVTPVNGRGLCPECVKKHERELELTRKNFRTDVDIHKIIDDAMEKKDRSVTIFITKDATTVSVYPYEDKPLEWTKNKGGTHTCPSCGEYQDFMTPYCPYCGEKLKRPN